LSDIEKMKSLAEEYRLKGEAVAYLETMEKLHQAEKDNIHYMIEILQTSVDLNRQDKLREYLDKALQLFPDHEKVKSFSRYLQSPTPNGQDKHDIENLSLTYNKSDLHRFRVLFQGREGVHARQFQEKKGRWGYSPVHSPIDNSLVVSHLDGDITLGLYFVRVDNTVLLGCIDFDMMKTVMESEDEEKKKKTRSELEEYVKKTAGVCKEASVPYLLEDSGNKGYHIWFFFKGGIEAKIARNFLKAITQKAGEPPKGVHYELFPKQDKVSSDGLGNLVKLPLGIHRKTGRRGLFVDPETLSPLPHQFQPLHAVIPLDEKSLVEKSDSLGKNPVREEFSLDRFSSNVKTVVSRCKVIEYIIQKAQREHHLLHPERVVLLYSVAFIPNEGIPLLHAIISLCSDYNYEITERYARSRKANWMSCPKIRQWIPDITRKVGCSCYFEDEKGQYPSPLRYINHEMEPDPDEIFKIFHEYNSLGKNIREMMERRKFLESKLTSSFEKLGVESIKTSSGTLIKTVSEGRTRFSLLIEEW